MTKRMTLMAVVIGVGLTLPAAAQAQRPTITTLDYYEIQNLYARYCHAFDSGADNGYMFADVFTTDGVFTDGSGQTFKGREALAGVGRGGPNSRKGPTNVGHFVTNVVIEPTATGASGKGYLMIGRNADAATNTRAAIVSGGQYWDELVKTSEGWRIKTRNLHRPGTTPAASAAAAAPAAQIVRTAASPAAAPGITAEDYAEIHHLYARYGYAFDGGVDEGRMWARMFTADGFHVNDRAGEWLKGHDALAEFARAAFRYDNGFITFNKAMTGTTKDVTRVGHIIVNVMLTPVAGGIASKAYRMTGSTNADGTANLNPGGIYFDYLVKTPDGWRYKEKFYIGSGNSVPEQAKKWINVTPAARTTTTASAR